MWQTELTNNDRVNAAFRGEADHAAPAEARHWVPVHAAAVKMGLWFLVHERLSGGLRGDTCSCSLVLRAVLGSAGVHSLRGHAHGAMIINIGSVHAVPKVKSGLDSTEEGTRQAVSQRDLPVHLWLLLVAKAVCVAVSRGRSSVPFQPQLLRIWNVDAKIRSKL